jgi:dipeptidyl aminopeptidase/acylaminoacyl peptidase
MLACAHHPELGSFAYLRRSALHVFDLASCRDRVVRRGVHGAFEFTSGGRIRVQKLSDTVDTADGRFAPSVRATGKGKTAKQTIWVTGRRTGAAHTVFSETQYYRRIGPGDTPGPIILLRWSGDDRWIFFTVYPGGSGSIAADGLILRVVSAAGGPVHEIAWSLASADYWSIACAPDGRSVVAQSQLASNNASFFATRWQLWRVGLDRSRRQLTSPPAHYADESPRFSRDGRTIVFVRSRHGRGQVYALRGRKLTGPLLSLGYQLGFYGHQNWWTIADWSLGAPR